MAYDPRKHNRRSIRLPDYDYSSPGAYFVTLNVQNRLHLFGEVATAQMKLSTAGQLAHDWWQKLPARYPGTALDAYIVMPDHLHGLLLILPDEDTSASDGPSQGKDAAVRAIHESPPQHQQDRPQQQHRLKRRRMLLSKMIGYYKMNTAKRINQLRATPGTAVWQRDYYEHVVRSRGALRRIRRYIRQNPAARHRRQTGQ